MCGSLLCRFLNLSIFLPCNVKGWRHFRLSRIAPACCGVSNKLLSLLTVPPATAMMFQDENPEQAAGGELHA